MLLLLLHTTTITTICTTSNTITVPTTKATITTAILIPTIAFITTIDCTATYDNDYRIVIIIVISDTIDDIVTSDDLDGDDIVKII